METAHIREAIQSSKFKKAITIIGLALLVLVIFAVGMEVGYMKAGFSYKFGESYYRSFGQDGAHPMGFVPGDVSDAHGVSGTIISIGANGLVIADQDKTEKAVVIGDDTVVRELRGTITPADLKIGDFIVIIGNPDDDTGDIDAKFIRVLPPPPAAMPASPAAATATPITN